VPPSPYLPSPSQGVWQLGPVPLRAYALAIITGVVLAVVIGERRWVARGGTRGVVTDIATIAVPFGIVGARLYHVVTSPQAYLTTPCRRCTCGRAAWASPAASRGASRPPG
jgi:prolipoprotein diacylglyceryltransferase